MAEPVKLGPNMEKFARELGTLADFVDHVRAVELRVKDRRATMRDPAIAEFLRTANGKRYLVVKSGLARVIDFRHFFAAAAEAYVGVRTARFAKDAFGASSGLASRDSTVLLGLGNELAQCVQEGSATASQLKSRINSCFSAEDLGTNRLGAEFGRALTIADATMGRRSIADSLQGYLTNLQPASPAEVAQVSAPSKPEVVLEALGALLTGLRGLVISEAY